MSEKPKELSREEKLWQYKNTKMEKEVPILLQKNMVLQIPPFVDG